MSEGLNGMGRTATRAQDARARAREARWAFLEARNAQDARIEEATVAALLALEERSAAQRAIAAALQRLAAEKLRVQDIAVLTGITEGECSRLLRTPANGTRAGETETADDAAG
ncbi:MAG: hypothetical protein ABJA74_08250 [Lapillicoccus sp.]